MSREIQSGMVFTCRKRSQKRCIHWFRMAMVGASIKVGLFKRMATSSPKTVFPEPGGAIICKCLLAMWSSKWSSTRCWYFRQLDANFISFGYTVNVLVALILLNVV